MKRLPVIILFASVLAAGCSDDSVTDVGSTVRDPGFATPAIGVAGIPGASYVDSYIVKLADGGLAPASGRRLVTARMVDVVEGGGGTVSREWTQIRRAQVRGIDEATAAALARVPGVESVTRDVLVPWVPKPVRVERLQLSGAPQAAPDGLDPAGAFFFGFQWNMQIIGVDKAFALEPGDPSVLIAILDSGITPEHIDLDGKVDLVRSRSNLDGGVVPECPDADVTDFRDFNFHGTHVASIVTGNNLGMASVASEGTLVAIKVLNCTGSGTFGDLIDALLYAADLEVDVINMSLGVPGGVENSVENRPFFTAVGEAVGVAIRAGAVVVNSAGNEGLRFFPRLNEHSDRNILVPGQTNGDIVIVSATGPINQTKFDRLASYSNFGRNVIDIAAPGGEFIAGNPNDFILGVCSPTSIALPFTCGPLDYVLVVGTSQAAPHVSGVAALIEARSGEDAVTIRRRLKLTADRVGTVISHGAGRVNAFRAVGGDD